MKEIELHSAEPAGVYTIDEEADRPEAIHQDGNGVFVICMGFALREPIPAEPLPEGDEESRVKRPSIIGHYTNDIVYARIAKGVLEELQKKNPTLPSGHRKHKHHQWFTPDPGHPKLKEHLAAVTALMRAAANWGQFQRSLKRAFPVQNDQYEMNLGDD